MPEGVSTSASVAGAEGTGGSSSETGSVFLKGRDGTTKQSSNPQAIQGQLGSGSPLDSGVKSRIGFAFGQDFSGVRIHTDAKAAQLSDDLNARAFTIGSDIAFGQGEYRPGTLIGDALIAHELAHTVQQGGGQSTTAPVQKGEAGYGSLEEDADMSAVGAVASIWGGITGEFTDISRNAIPRLRSGLRLQRCSGCDCNAPPVPSLLDRLLTIRDTDTLVGELQELTEDQLSQLRNDAPADSMLQDGVRWEIAFLNKNWRDIADYHRSDTFSFYQPYNRWVVELIIQGQTTINIRGDQDFKDWVESLFLELGSRPTGFRLIVELLATEQTVNIDKTAGGHETQNRYTEQQPEAGRFVTKGESGELLPFGRQRRGTPTGSNITLNPDVAMNQVTLGGSPGNLQIIEQEETVTFGHELIHALHNALGENIGPPDFYGPLARAFGMPNFLVLDPATGLVTNPEELRTITGQTGFQPPPGVEPGSVSWATRFNLPSRETITENMLRAEFGLPERVSHRGGTRSYRVTVSKGETLNQMLNRYYLAGGGSIPDALRSALRGVFLEFNPYFRDNDSAPMQITLDFPHGEFMALHMAVINQPDLAETAIQLRLRGAL